MTTLEITLIIIGVVFLIGSFMVNDKLSHKERLIILSSLF